MTIIHIVLLNASFSPNYHPQTIMSCNYLTIQQFKPDVDQAAIEAVREFSFLPEEGDTYYGWFGGTETTFAWHRHVLSYTLLRRTAWARVRENRMLELFRVERITVLSQRLKKYGALSSIPHFFVRISALFSWQDFAMTGGQQKVAKLRFSCRSSDSPMVLLWNSRVKRIGSFTLSRTRRTRRLLRRCRGW